MTFSCYLLRFTLLARAPIHFPPAKAGNVLRGAFGLAFRATAPPEIYKHIFEPAASKPNQGPSGLADWPRPFVFRCAHLDGRTIAPGEHFHIDLNLFELRTPVMAHFTEAFRQLAHNGIGPSRGRAELIGLRDRGDGTQTEHLAPVHLSLDPPPQSVTHIAIEFLTPTELKSESHLLQQPEFPALAARARDRVATLSALYGNGPLDADFKGMSERAATVRMTRSDVQHLDIDRVSSRTGQRHPLGGFVGLAEYQGPLSEFVPWLEAAALTGIGRQTTWGKGEFKLATLK